MIPAMISMSAMEKVQQRAEKQQSIRQKLHDMRSMFRPEKIRRDGEKSD
jgi:hypothetical protein